MSISGLAVFGGSSPTKPGTILTDTIGLNGTLSSAGQLRCSPAHASHCPRSCAGGAELRAEDHRREDPAHQERERRRSELGAAGIHRDILALIETRQEGEFLSGALVNPRGRFCPGASSSSRTNGIAAEASGGGLKFCHCSRK